MDSVTKHALTAVIALLSACTAAGPPAAAGDLGAPDVTDDDTGPWDALPQHPMDVDQRDLGPHSPGAHDTSHDMALPDDLAGSALLDSRSGNTSLPDGVVGRDTGLLDGESADTALPDRGPGDIALPDGESADIALADGGPEDIALPDGGSEDTALPDGQPGDDTALGTGSGYALDDALRVNHIQALGTHNSYHVQPLAGVLVPPWAYTHLPLDEQLGAQGVRKFELDLHWKDGQWKVFHIDFVDQDTTCDTLGACLEALSGWSSTHPGHHPFLMLLEVKEGYSESQAAERLASMDLELMAAFGEGGLLTPDDVQGVHDNVRDALAADGWPTLGEARGRALCVLHDGGDWRDAYTNSGTSTVGRACFADAFGDAEAPFAAYHSMNDPVGSFDAIQATVAAGHLVRTRADSDSVEALLNDTTRFEAALASGAHFISTDYPATIGQPVNGYQLSIPQGTPSRCNPLIALPECTPSDIESPELLAP